MKINKAGIELIKSFEGCRLKAYRCAAGVLTIGWGHTAGVKEGQTITQQQADEFLLKDLAKFEKAVNAISQDFNENQFSALVSFAFNCGVRNLNQLCNGRTKAEIGSKMLLYNKANGKVLAGLTRRRRAENKLYNTDPVSASSSGVLPNRALKKGMKGNDVIWLQESLNKHGANLTIDGIFGSKTENALKDFQKKIFVSGILDANTKSALLRLR